MFNKLVKSSQVACRHLNETLPVVRFGVSSERVGFLTQKMSIILRMIRDMTLIG